ncbi:hypothetical protein NXV33_07810 [Bacteroides thetaiotaomicron]|nr:hypothetical protein [Bacteroides thetaiotaomicron]
MGMILRIASSRIVGQGDIVGRSGYFSLNLSANSVMRGRLDARRTLKSLVADLRVKSIGIEIVEDLSITGEVGQTMIRNKAKYVRTMQELNAAYMAFCAKMLGSGYEKVSIKTLAVALLEVMEDLFEPV